MLSRVADALYWMGRYLERAENTTRLLLVAEELSTDVVGIDEDLARAEWTDLLAIFPGAGVEPGVPAAAEAAALPYLRAFSIDARNPYSVYCSLRRARENARTVREALTVEVFVNLNETYRDLEAAAREPAGDPPVFRAALSAAHRGILSTVGAIEHTLTRDQGWLFLKLGESLERVFRTAAILRAKLPALISPEPKLDLPLVHTRWRSLLRGVSALENYRRSYGARLEPLDVLQFTLFDPHAPRSLRYGAAAVQGYLDRIAGSAEVTAPARVAGKLAAELTYRDEEVVRRQDYTGFLDHVLEELGRTHETVSAFYFGA